MNDELMTVTQADRDAAQALCASGWTHAIEAFARHRQQAVATASAGQAAMVEELERLRAFVTWLANNPRKPATWMQTREAAALLLAEIDATRANATSDE